MTRYHPPPEARLPFLVQVALWVLILLGGVVLLRLLPAGTFVALAIGLVALLALLTWNPVVTLAVASALTAGAVARHRGRLRSGQ